MSFIRSQQELSHDYEQSKGKYVDIYVTINNTEYVIKYSDYCEFVIICYFNKNSPQSNWFAYTRKVNSDNWVKMS